MARMQVRTSLVQRLSCYAVLRMTLGQLEQIRVFKNGHPIAIHACKKEPDQREPFRN